MYIRTRDGFGEAESFVPDFIKEQAGRVKEGVKRGLDLVREPSPLVTGGQDALQVLLPTSVLHKVGPHVAPQVHHAAARAKPAIPREKVCWIQIVLNKTSSENLEPDGLYGPRTREAVRRFQTRSGLSGDGVVGPQTNTALIQIALNQIAQASLLPVNGVGDEKLQQEIKRFQSQNKITPDGLVGLHTRAAMVNALGGKCVFRAGGGPPPPQPPPPRKCEVTLADCMRERMKCVAKCALETGLHNYPIDCLLKLPDAKAAVACLLKRGIVHPQIQHLYDFDACGRKGCLPWFRNCEAAARDCK